MDRKTSGLQVLRNILDHVCYSKPEHILTVAKEWLHVFNVIDLSVNAKVLELGSGLSPKLLAALSEYNFSGEFSILDMDTIVLEAMRDHASLMQTYFQFGVMADNFWDASLDGYDYIFANHFIDDLALHWFSKYMHISYNEILNNYILQHELFTELGANKHIYHSFLSKLCSAFMQVNIGTTLILNNYMARFEEKYKLDSKNHIVNKLLKDMQKKLTSKLFITSADHVTSYKNMRWIITKKMA